MRKALQELLDHYVGLVNCGDCGNWDLESEAEVQQARAALRLEHEPRHSLLRIDDSRLATLYETYAERAAMETCGVREDIDVAKALRELIDMRAAKSLPAKEG